MHFRGETWKNGQQCFTLSSAMGLLVELLLRVRVMKLVSLAAVSGAADLDAISAQIAACDVHIQHTQTSAQRI